MKAETFEDEQPFLHLYGVCLSPDELVKLKIALLKLRQDRPLEETRFWGKIECVSKNYYLAVVLRFSGSFQFPHKTFFWAGPDFVFRELPALNPYHTVSLIQLKGMFSGDPLKVVLNVEGDPDNPDQPPADTNPEGDGGEGKQAAKQDDYEIKVPPKNLLQVQRLACTVLAIENDCQLFPEGAFNMTSIHELKPNPVFRGLPVDKLCELRQYQHFRAAQSNKTREELKSDHTLFRYNFLDCLTEDKPRGCWAIQKDSTGRKVTIRSLKWVGFFGYHEAETPTFGCVYVGDGLINADLPFMI